jgi:hypothetical protein
MKTNKVKWMAIVIAVGICSIAFARKMALTPCETECTNKSIVKYKICLRLAPQNQSACITRVFAELASCKAACQ